MTTILSLSDTYQSIKKNKPETHEKVIYAKTISDVTVEIEKLKTAMSTLQTSVSDLQDSVKKLESLKMPEFTDKHARMKDSYNQLVSNVSASQLDTHGVIQDIAKRINELEARLGL